MSAGGRAGGGQGVPGPSPSVLAALGRMTQQPKQQQRQEESTEGGFQILGLTKSKVRDGLPSSQRATGLQLPKCVCSQSTVFMKLSDSTSTSDSAWVLLGYSRSRTGTFRALRAW